MGFFSSQHFEAAGIDRVLNDLDCTLEKVLDSPDCLQECLCANITLLQYLSEEENIANMLDLMLLPLDQEVPCLMEDETADSGGDSSMNRADPSSRMAERRARLAYAASEVYASEALAVIAETTKRPEMLRKIFSFLSAPPPLSVNKVYFSKVLSALQRNVAFASRMTEWLYKSSASGEFDVIAALLRHISEPCVQQALLTLLIFHEGCDHVSEEGGTPTTPSYPVFPRWSMAHGLPNAMVATLQTTTGDPEFDESSIAGVLWIAVNVLSLDNNGQNVDILKTLHFLISWLSGHSKNGEDYRDDFIASVDDDVAKQLPSSGPLFPPFVPEVVSLLINSAKADSQSVITPVASDILQRITRAYTTVPHTDPPQHTSTFGLQCILEHGADFIELLTSPPTGSQPLTLQAFTVKVPFGLMRLKILELLRSIATVMLPEVMNWFIDEKILPVLMQIFEEYPNNSLVHSQVIGTFRSLIDAGLPEIDKALVEDVKILDWAVRLYKEGIGSGHIVDLIFSMKSESRPYCESPLWDTIAKELDEEVERRRAKYDPWLSLYEEAVEVPIDSIGTMLTSERVKKHLRLEEDGEEIITLTLPPPPADGTDGDGANERQPSSWDLNPMSDPDDLEAFPDSSLTEKDADDAARETGSTRSNTPPPENITLPPFQGQDLAFDDLEVPPEDSANDAQPAKVKDPESLFPAENNIDSAALKAKSANPDEIPQSSGGGPDESIDTMSPEMCALNTQLSQDHVDRMSPLGLADSSTAGLNQAFGENSALDPSQQESPLFPTTSPAQNSSATTGNHTAEAGKLMDIVDTNRKLVGDLFGPDAGPSDPAAQPKAGGEKKTLAQLQQQQQQQQQQPAENDRAEWTTFS
ncbi:Extragenic suppressor of kinetochore protein 1 [Diplonema papillatum]|nr:Extragenic suppressor of kinetochore protein 1 [Diplonema papillatum]